MTALTRFPSRIRFVNADGTLTPEALRMLDALVTRVGGDLGDNGDDVFAMPTSSDGGTVRPPDIFAAGSPAGHQAMDVLGIASPASHMAPIDLAPATAGHFSEITFQGSSE